MGNQKRNPPFLFGFLTACLAASTPLAAQPGGPEPVTLVRMPDETPMPTIPTDAEMEAFLAQHEGTVHISIQDLRRSPILARKVLGQNRIIAEAKLFQRLEGIPVSIKFIDWGDAFRFFSDYVADSTNPPVVAQLGDSWAPYFQSLGVVSHQKRFSWDVRLLWYWKDLASPDQLLDGESFKKVCQRILDSRPEGVVSPFVIPTALNWNLLHDLSIWLYNAGLPSVISVDPKLGVVPWKEAVFAGPEGQRAARFLIDLARLGYVDLPDRSTDQVADEFLQRKYAMAILGSWVADRARIALGSQWVERIGATLPPRLGSAPATTVKGGSYLVIIDPSRGRDLAAIQRAGRLVDFLSGPESQFRSARNLGDLPGNPLAMPGMPHHELFEEALQVGKTYPAIREWAPIVENLTTRDNLYAFWKRLAALTDTTDASDRSGQATREKLILAALSSAQSDVNRELSPGKLSLLWPWVLGLVTIAGAAFAISVHQRQVEKRQAEAKLRASEQKYRDLYDNAPDMFCSVDTETGRIVHCNRMLLTKTGYGKEEVLGRHIFDMYHADSLEDVRRASESLYQTGALSDIELQLRCKDGGKLDVSLNVSAVRDEDGRIIRTRSVWRDITERKRAEADYQLQRQELAHVARAATLGELSASLAHELNQPLAAIVSNAQAGERIMRLPSPDLAEVAEVLRDIASDGKRASEVIRRLRALLTKGCIERAPVDLNQVIEEVVQLIRGDTLIRGIQIRLELVPDLPLVPGDRVQLQQVVLNLVLNAAEAISQIDDPCRELVVKAFRPSPDHVEVAVQDCGIGIAAESFDRIFDAFYSTKPNGLGMGLSINRSIIEAHGGRIWVTPNQDRGVTFHFTLPVQRTPRGRKRIDLPPTRAKTEKETTPSPVHES